MRGGVRLVWGSTIDIESPKQEDLKTMAHPSSNDPSQASNDERKVMKPEVPHRISIWENRYEEHKEKQLHNPFSEWSQGSPKKALTSPTGEYSNPPKVYISRSPSPLDEPAETFSPLPCYQVPFNPFDHCPKPYSPVTFNPPAPSRDFIPVSPTGYPATYSNPPRSPDVNFLSRVMKWRKPDTEIEDLVPLTQIPQPAKPPEPIKVNIPIPPLYEDPVSTSPFSPPILSWTDRTGQISCSSPRVENPGIGNWSGQPEIENLSSQPEIDNSSGQPENNDASFTPASQFTPYEEEEPVPQWKPMGKTFANVIGGMKKTEDNIDQSHEAEYSDMNYRRENLSSQIDRWQQHTLDHERKQLLNPFSGWEGASHHNKLSKTDADYGKPIEGSMTELRGKKAGDHISNEIAELCRVITDFGKRQPDNSVLIKFGNLFQVYTSISNKLVGMLMRARKQGLLHFEGEMLYQGRDNDVVIKLLQAAERQTTESAVGIKSGNQNEAVAGFGGAPAELKSSASGNEASATGYSAAEMMSKSESANSASSVMKKDSSICSSSMMNEGSSMSMREESLGSSKMMASSSNSSQVMSKEDGEFSTKMFAGSSNTSKMMAREESSSSTKMLSESSSSMKMLKEEDSINSQMLGGAVGDSAKMLAGVSISPAALMDSLKAAEMKKKMVPAEGNTSQQIMPCDLGAVSNMSSSSQQASSLSSSSMMSSKQMSSTSEQMSMAKTEQMTSAMENLSMSSAESNQMNVSSAQMISANEQMSMSNKQMSMASGQMSAVNKQMSSATEQMSMSNQQMSSATEQMSMSNQQMSTEQMSMSNQQMSSATEQMSMSNQQMSSSSQSSNEMMPNILDDSFSNMVSTQGMTTSSSIQKTSQQSSSSKVLSKNFSSFESSGMSLMDDTDSFMSSDIQDLKKLT